MVKNPLANAGDIRDTRLIPGLERSPGGGHGTHSSILAWRIPMDRGAWWATVHKVTKSQTRLKLLSTHTHDKSKCLLQKNHFYSISSLLLCLLFLKNNQPKIILVLKFCSCSAS